VQSGSNKGSIAKFVVSPQFFANKYHIGIVSQFIQNPHLSYLNYIPYRISYILFPLLVIVGGSILDIHLDYSVDN
jgi:hypothetical protein